eukprot:CAMPEP_0181515466 /NCGR_PEP_ID=MMETSP1110-20121109/63588_1 /TAXON_ID=174948 /ORGANISM="Symbiodinium sp., Strain CCMP421" /LENGTH=42 /DNA_ID= /DNA_START= /DNA_END= /DNA_ORIENTATION=
MPDCKRHTAQYSAAAAAPGWATARSPQMASGNLLRSAASAAA